MNFILLILGVIDKSDYYNTKARPADVPPYPGVGVFQLLYLRYIKRVPKGKLYNIVPWGQENHG